MYETNEYPTQGTVYGSNPDRRRKWLAVSGIVAAALILLLVIMAANHVRSNQASAAQALSTPTATPSTEPTGEPAEGEGEETEQPGPGPGGEGGGTNPGGGNPGGGDQGNSGGGDQDGEEPEEPEQPEPAEPLSIEATIDTVTPGGQCFASGTITVSGGEYPMTVHYQWRRLALGQGLDGLPVSAVHNFTLDGPGSVGVQTSDLPEDGTNVFLIVTGPKDAGSGLVEYDGCADGPGSITNGD
jgi:hypothetical protein